jgi:GDP-L-fucose synthase
MFYNLLSNKSNFNKFIHFGSGAELGMPTDPYGLSKNIINRIIEQEPNFYNIRIYGVFDENELDTRFIKSNIKRYINKKPMEIYQNKFMDFFYMEDLISLVKYYIDNLTPPKISECSYEQKYSLLDIAQMINKQSNYNLPIQFKELNYGESYNGKMTLPIKVIGLKKGIQETYKKIKIESN